MNYWHFDMYVDEFPSCKHERGKGLKQKFWLEHAHDFLDVALLPFSSSWGFGKLPLMDWVSGGQPCAL